MKVPDHVPCVSLWRSEIVLSPSPHPLMCNIIAPSLPLMLLDYRRVLGQESPPDSYKPAWSPHIIVLARLVHAFRSCYKRRAAPHILLDSVEKDRPAQSPEPPGARASRLQRCSGSAATEHDLCEDHTATSTVNWAKTLDCVVKGARLGRSPRHGENGPLRAVHLERST